jgi:small-conductance mechanosensitive channel
VIDLISEPWFWPAVVVVVGVPVLLLVLTELYNSLLRRGSRAARIVALIRNFLVPVGGLLLLLSQTAQVNTPEFTWTRVAATVFGFLVILVLLNGLNLAFFVTAKSGTWRNRLPSIFIDIARAVLIIVCLSLLFSVVWNADIAGLFTALGIGGIVIGFALQNAVGSVVSGLFLLFERPFEIGDYLRTSEGKGKVVEINWRAVHIDTTNGIRVIPNSELADNSFENLSRSTEPYETSAIVKFTTDDPAQEVIDLLVQVAMDLPKRHPDVAPYASPLGKAKYEVCIPMISPAGTGSTVGLFLTRLWYAARRADLHLDGDLTDNYRTPQRLLAALNLFAPSLYLTREEAAALTDEVRLERYGEGEVVQRVATVPDGMRFILTGSVQLATPVPGGGELPVSQLVRKDVLGLAALTRQAVAVSATASSELAVLWVPVAVLDRLVKTRPALARDIGTEIDNRRNRTLTALEKAGYDEPRDSLVLG